MRERVFLRREAKCRDYALTKAKRVNEKLAAVQPPKEEPDDSPDSQARKARKLRLTKLRESRVFRRAKISDMAAFDRALGKLMIKERYQSKSHEQWIQAIRAVWERVLVDRLARGLSEKFLIMKLIKQKNPLVKREQEEDMKGGKLKEAGLDAMEGLEEGLEKEYQELEEEEWGAELEGLKEELEELKEEKLKETRYQEGWEKIRSSETEFDRLERGLKGLNRKELKKELEEEELEAKKLEKAWKEKLVDEPEGGISESESLDNWDADWGDELLTHSDANSEDNSRKDLENGSQKNSEEDSEEDLVEDSTNEESSAEEDLEQDSAEEQLKKELRLKAKESEEKFKLKEGTIEVKLNLKLIKEESKNEPKKTFTLREKMEKKLIEGLRKLKKNSTKQVHSHHDNYADDDNIDLDLDLDLEI